MISIIKLSNSALPWKVVAPPIVAPAETARLLIVAATPTVKFGTSKVSLDGLYLGPESTFSCSPNVPVLFSTNGKK